MTCPVPDAMITESTTTVVLPRDGTTPAEGPSKPQLKRSRRKRSQLVKQKKLEAQRQGPQAAAAAGKFATTTTSSGQSTKKKQRLSKHDLEKRDLEKRRKRQASRTTRRLKREFYLDLEKLTAGMAGLGRAAEEEAGTQAGMGMELDA